MTLRQCAANEIVTGSDGTTYTCRPNGGGDLLWGTGGCP